MNQIKVFLKWADTAFDTSFHGSISHLHRLCPVTWSVLPGYVISDAGHSPNASVLSLGSSLSGWAWLLCLIWSQGLALLNLEAIKNGQDLQIPSSCQGPAKIVVCIELWIFTHISTLGVQFSFSVVFFCCCCCWGWIFEASKFTFLPLWFPIAPTTELKPITRRLPWAKPWNRWRFFF